MITEQELKELFKKSESDILDFKAKIRLDNDHFKSKFIKDILAMANTPREKTAFIIIGVKAYPNGDKDYPGFVDHPDDADLQDYLNKVDVQPSRPRFHYYPIKVDAKSYGVIEIPVQYSGPYIPEKTLEKIQEKALYYRNSTQNNEAKGQKRNEIFNWFNRKKSEQERATTSDGTISIDEIEVLNWAEFYQACQTFDKNRLYCFIIGPNSNLQSEMWGSLARLPLSLVLDFDPQTQESGAFANASLLMKNYRSVYQVTKGNSYNLNPGKACHWYAAMGLQGKATSLVEHDWRKWNRAYVGEMRKLFEEYKKASGGRPMTLVCLWNAPKYLSTIATIVDEFFGDSATFVFAFPEVNKLSREAEQFDAHTVSIRVENVLFGISQYIASYNDQAQYQAGIPKKDGTTHLLSKQVLSWLSEDLDILHSNIELDTPDGPEYHYLQGAVINWSDLNNHLDADRDDRPKIQKIVGNELRSREARRLNLYHWPGAGGTTVARRVAWELRSEYPVVILNRVIPESTSERFREIFGITELPILAVVEGADVVPDKLDQLFNEVKAQNIPVIFLSVVRRFKIPPKSSPRTVFLGQTLSLKESYRFTETFKRVIPEKTIALEKILLDDNPRNRTPFQFALTAFGRDFIGITKYVEARLEVATPIQKELVTFLAMAYYYGHKPILAQIFAVHLGHSESRQLRLERLLNEPQLELLVQEANQQWRPAHNLISEQILEIVLSGDSNDRRNWKWNLSFWSISLLDACSKGLMIPHNDLIDLMRRIFILRDENELMGTESSGMQQFSQLIEDIPSLEGRLNVLKELVDAFPYESHFWGHLGRFYSLEMKEFDNAIEAINQALKLSKSEDSVLYHMKGMCYRKLASEQMAEISRNFRAERPVEEDLKDLRTTIEAAKEAFSFARQYSPNTEHGYISAIQMLLDILDFGYKISGMPTHAEFLTSPNARWYTEQLDEIEDLLSRVKNVQEGERESRYVRTCQADLYNIYDDYEQALQGWDSLLNDRDVYAPPIRRQIVHAYLNRKRRDWAALPPREIERIVTLMEDNLREEPGSDYNIRIWFRAVRYSERQDINIVLDRLATWKAIGDAEEAYFYLYVLHALKAIDGSIVERGRSLEFIKHSADKSRYRRNRHLSQEWLGVGEGLSRLVHYNELGNWDRDKNFYQDESKLARIKGYVSHYKGPEAGTIELVSCGLPAFFVPATVKVGNRVTGITKDHLNLPVTFYLGFSYDGLRAWSVEELRDEE